MQRSSVLAPRSRLFGERKNQGEKQQKKIHYIFCETQYVENKLLFFKYI